MTQDQYLSKYFTILANPKLYSSLLYLALAFPLGLTYFIFLVVGFSVGLSLLKIWMGFIVLAFLFPLTWLIINFERIQTTHLLGISLPENKPQTKETKSMIVEIKNFLTDPTTWRGLLFIALKFPIGLVAFIALVTGFAFVFACLFSPLMYQFGTINLGFWKVDIQ